jgi:hypothetical protein
MLNFRAVLRIRDEKLVGSGSGIKHPGSATLLQGFKVAKNFLRWEQFTCLTMFLVEDKNY